MNKFLFMLMIASIKVHINQYLPLPLQKKFAQKRLLREIHNAYKNVPYYKEKYDEAGVDINAIKSIKDIKKIPLITKEEIHNQFPQGIVAKGVDINKCHYSATTGSTGKSLPFIYSPWTYAFYLATSFRVQTMTGFKPWHKSAYIKYTPADIPRLGPFFITTQIPSTISLEEQLAILLKTKPDHFAGYASIIYEISQSLKPEDIASLNIKQISVNSEMSTKDERDFIAKVFECQVYDEYSTEETWMVSSECRNHNYHLFIDNVWVEFLDKNGNDVAPGEIGEIVLSTTRSPAMPFIRYKIGDLGRYSNRKCSCNLGFPLIESFDGRSDDSFILPSGRYISSLKILNTFTKFITNHLHLMEEFKVLQKKKELIIIYLVKGKEYNEETFNDLIDTLREIFEEPVTITVELVDKIDTAGQIKRKAIESLVAR